MIGDTYDDAMRVAHDSGRGREARAHWALAVP